MERTELKRIILYKYGTSKAFANACGCTEANVSRVLKGEYLPRIDTLMVWADKLGITPTQTAKLLVPQWK